MEEHFYTVSELADLLKSTDSGITRLIRLGYIHAFRFGPGKRSPYRISHLELERLQRMGFEETLSALRPLIRNLSS